MLLTLLAKTIYTADANGNLLDSDPTFSDIPPEEYGAVFAKMLLTFLALIALMVGTYWFLKRLIRSRSEKNVRNLSIQLLEKRMISSKSALYLIEVEGQKILLAESQHEIRRLQNWNRIDPPLQKNSTDTTDGSFNEPKG